LIKSPADFIAARIEASHNVTAGLKLATKKIFGFDRQEILALIDRIEQCSSRSNHFVATDAINMQTGECYEAIGTLWNCGSKLCPNCIAAFSRRNRKKLREAIERQKMRRHERYYFATFTIVNPSASLTATRALVDRAWCLFRKRKLCVDLVRGGSKSEEFTLTPNGYHYHLHCIWLSRYIHFQEVRRVWTECVDQAFTEAGLKLTVDTEDGLLWVKIYRVNDMSKAIFEVAKYITKSDSWSKMKPDHLAEVALIRRWHRMFELYGSFANRTQKPVDADDAQASSPIVHTSDLSDGCKPSHSELWRDTVQNIGLELYRERLIEEIIRCRELRMMQLQRRWPTARISFADEFL